MTLFKGADAAFPGALLPAGTQILAAYVGASDLAGPPDTPHIWSVPDWNTYITANPELRLLPLYVHSFPGDPVADANNAVDAVLDLGWRPGAGRLIVMDIETLVDPPYVQALGDQVHKRDFRALVYGSTAFLYQNPPIDGYFPANLTRFPPKSLPKGTEGDQWQWDRTWDLDVFTQFVYDNCGHGLRRVVA